MHLHMERDSVKYILDMAFSSRGCLLQVFLACLFQVPDVKPLERGRCVHLVETLHGKFVVKKVLGRKASPNLLTPSLVARILIAVSGRNPGRRLNNLIKMLLKTENALGNSRMIL